MLLWMHALYIVHHKKQDDLLAFLYPGSFLTVLRLARVETNVDS